MQYPPPSYGYAPAPEQPAEMPYLEGQPIPPGYHQDTKARTGLIAAGAAVFGGLWLVSAGVGLAYQELQDDLASAVEKKSKDKEWPLVIPLAGPFITIGTAHAQQEASFLLVVDGLGQCAGVAMFIAGFAAPKQVLVYDGSAKVMVLPTNMGTSGAGLTALGTF